MESSLFLEACANRQTQRPPVWFMRQAGRCLPEYRALRETYSFVEMIHHPELACEVTLQPLKRFGYDAAILYSDILILSEYFDLHFLFKEKIGPYLKESDLSISALLEQLESIKNPDAFLPVYQAITLLRKELSASGTPLIGFAGSPFTVGCYLIEKGSSKTFSTVLNLIKEDPETCHRLLQALTTASITYLTEQIRYGVQAIQLFDTWGSLLKGTDYETFSFQYLRQIFEALQDSGVPLILYSKEFVSLQSHISTLPLQVVGVDWNCSIPDLKQAYPHFAFQGQLNPHVLLEDKDLAVKHSRDLCEQMANQPGFIFNLGHGILPKTPLDHIQAVLDVVRG